MTTSNSPEAKEHSFGDLIERYEEDVLSPRKRSRQERFVHLEWWKERLGDYPLSGVTPALISETRESLAKGTTYRGIQRSPATVARYLASLSHVLTVAVKDWEWINESPFPKGLLPKGSRDQACFSMQTSRTKKKSRKFDSEQLTLF